MKIVYEMSFNKKLMPIEKVIGEFHVAKINKINT